jgi:exodeoxyribonuclease V gamma subunit
MLRIHQSNRLDVLAHVLNQYLARPVNDDPLAPEIVVVQNPGMAQWLKLQIAEASGIAAGLEFPMPASFVWQVIRSLDAQTPEVSSYSREQLAWRTFALLPKHLSAPEFHALSRYLADDGSGLKRWQLASRIADVFDQYLVYRPDWLIGWEAGDEASIGVSDDEPWQPVLWRALVEGAGGEPHRAALLRNAIRALVRGDAAELPSRMFVFGISSLAPAFLEFFAAVGARTEVVFLAFNPCAEYWSDIVSERFFAELDVKHRRAKIVDPADYYSTGNPLLGSMGRLGRDFVDLLIELAEGNESSELADHFVEPEERRWLGNVQGEILRAELRGGQKRVSREDVLGNAGKKPVERSDRSIAIHNCHSPVRELEVLHDQLLARFEEDPSLAPRDVVVMIPDIERYAPFIEAVFGAAPAKRRIPYAISDRGVYRETPLIEAFMRLLEVPKLRFGASEILSFLGLPAVLRRFELTESDFEQISYWVAAANVRWGRDGAQWEALKLPTKQDEVQPNTWSFGLDRMLLGYAMDEAMGPFGNVLPVDGIEGQDAALVGALCEFLSRLEKIVGEFGRAASASVWARRVGDLLDAFFEPDADEEVAVREVRRLAREVDSIAADVSLDEALTLDVVRAYFEDRLRLPPTAPARFLAGEVTFCTLVPMRTVPFRMVCLVGMNDQDFPRRRHPYGFDLMARTSRKGDRSRRLDDRYLFLEALMSARERLYISYTGHDQRDNSEKVPSVLVSELIDYLELAFQLEGETAEDHTGAAANLRAHLIADERLQPFSRAYYDASRELFTYEPMWAPMKVADRISSDTRRAVVAPPPRVEEISLGEFTRYYRDPCRYFLRRLGVRLELDEEEGSDEEPFGIHFFDTYWVKQDALETALDGAPLEDWTAKERLRGLWPMGGIGDDLIARTRDETEAFLQSAGEILRIPGEAAELRVRLGRVELSGRAQNLTDSGLLFFRTGKLTSRNRVDLWIAHLVRCAGGAPQPAYLVDEEKAERMVPLSAESARRQLEKLIEIYHEGLEEPLPLFIRSSTAFAERMAKGNDPERSRRGARGTWESEREDPYVARLFDEQTFWETPFREYAELVYLPMYWAIEERTHAELVAEVHA